MRTQHDVHELRTLEVLTSSPQGEMTAAAVLKTMEERFGHLLNDIDREHHANGSEKWQTRARRTSGYMVDSGLLTRPPTGIWKITAAGRAATNNTAHTPAAATSTTTKATASYGDIPGIPAGSIFENRKAAYDAGVHPTTQASIAGPGTGVYSICMSDGYSDDEFNDDLITYTGAGGIDQNTKRHVADQELKGWNLGLVRNHENGQPIRVLAKRSVLTKNPKDVDYLYLGLYTVENWAWNIREGFKVLVYQLQAVPGISLGAEETAQELHRGSDTPPGRKQIKSNQITRDIKVSNTVKRLYSNQCQTCNAKIITAAGPYSEGAHIRPLGAPHNGPDTLSNMLCLCPNCHTMFDGKALWIDHSGLIHIMGVPTRELMVKTAHQLDNDQLSYHRSLCGLTST